MICINRYYSGTDGNTNAEPKWYCKNYLDFCIQTENKYKDHQYRSFTYDSNNEICIYVKEVNKFRTFIQKRLYGNVYHTYFFINTDTKEELEQFLRDANVKIGIN